MDNTGGAIIIIILIPVSCCGERVFSGIKKKKAIAAASAPDPAPLNKEDNDKKRSRIIVKIDNIVIAQ